jgi:hypothetical protein
VFSHRCRRLWKILVYIDCTYGIKKNVEIIA